MTPEEREITIRLMVYCVETGKAIGNSGAFLMWDHELVSPEVWAGRVLDANLEKFGKPK